MKPTLIYQPKGPAGEYAKWAVNLHNGCTHGCTYCYNRRGFMSHAFGEEPKLASPIVKKIEKTDLEPYFYRGWGKRFAENSRLADIVGNFLIADVEKIGKERLIADGGVFLSFKCDPLELSNYNATVPAVLSLTDEDIPVSILTKCTAWLQDPVVMKWFSIKKSLLTIGYTITGMDDMELYAPSTTERIEALRKVHDMGIKTFVSLEPVIDIKKAMKVIKECNGLADEICIGVQSPIKKDRYDVRELEAFVAFLHRLVHFEDFNSYITIKRSLCHQIDYLPAAFRRECAGLITEIWMNQQTEETE